MTSAIHNLYNGDMTTVTTTIEDGVISLPKPIREKWQDGEVFLVPLEDTLVIKKIQSEENLSSVAGKVRSPSITKEEINAEIQAYRKSKNK